VKISFFHISSIPQCRSKNNLKKARKWLFPCERLIFHTTKAFFFRCLQDIYKHKKTHRFRLTYPVIERDERMIYVAVPPFLVYDTHFILIDNGITGPDWGHSELVFICRPIRYSHQIISLSVMASHITRLFIVFLISKNKYNGLLLNFIIAFIHILSR